MSKKDKKINEENLLDQLFFYQVSYQEKQAQLYLKIGSNIEKEERFKKLFDKLFFRLSYCKIHNPYVSI